MASTDDEKKLSRRELLSEWGWGLVALGAGVALPGASVIYENFRTSYGSNPKRYVKIAGLNPRAASEGWWAPSKVVVTKGTEVTLQLVAEDVVHGFALPAYDINEILRPGHPHHEVTFIADEVGEFEYYCSIGCGDGHRAMTGKFIVEEG